MISVQVDRTEAHKWRWVKWVRCKKQSGDHGCSPPTLRPGLGCCLCQLQEQRRGQVEWMALTAIW